MFGLFINQGGIHLEQSRYGVGAGVFHRRKTPKRVAFIDQIERSFAFKRGVEWLVCREALLLPVCQIPFGRRSQRVEANMAEACRRLSRTIRGEQFNLRAAPAHCAQHLLDVDRTPFPAEDRHAWISSDISDA